MALVVRQNRNTAILQHSVNFAKGCPNARQTILYDTHHSLLRDPHENQRVNDINLPGGHLED